MARILKLSKRAAHTFTQVIANSEPQRDILTVMRFRRLAKRFRECFKDYYDTRLAYDKAHDAAMLEYARETPEWYEALREHNRNCYQLAITIGQEPARDEHTDGILVETEDFKWLSDKFKNLKGLPTDGEAGDIWEEIYEAFENAIDTKIKAVAEADKKELASA